MKDQHEPAGRVSFRRSLHCHPADGMTAHVSMGGGASMTLLNPWAGTHMEWVCRYGNVESVRYSIASVLGSYGYLLGGDISTREAIRRLRIVRSAIASLHGRPLGEVGAPGYDVGGAE